MINMHIEFIYTNLWNTDFIILCIYNIIVVI